MRFAPQLLDDIRNRLPLSEVVSRRVTWDRRKSQPGKGDYWACCPFHQENTPSFHVDDRRNRYKCFGCGASGDHFRFLTDTEGLSFPEAVEQLAEMAGVALPAPDPQAAKKQQQRTSLTDVCELAAKYFRSVYLSPQGEHVRAYAARRKLSAEVQEEFVFGFAPPGRDNLKKALLERGVEEAMLVEAGLVIKPDDGRPSYDRFRNRLMIPIHDERGRVVAFGGRTMDPEGQPKYLNSPETPIFYKGTMLFNAHRARQPAFESKQAIVVEGYMDAIAVWQAGFKGVVASLGTAFTEEQCVRLWKFADEPIICFDGDAAGISAAHRSIDRILPVLASGKSFQFSLLPDGKDPDDLISEKGPQGFNEELAKALPLSQVVWDRETSQARIDTPERKAALEKAFDDLIATIKDERVRNRYQRDFRLRLSNLFYEESRRARGATGSGDRKQGGSWNQASGKQGRYEVRGFQSRVAAPETAKFGTERTLCAMCLTFPDLFDRHYERISQLHFTNELHQRFMDEYCRFSTDLKRESVAAYFSQLDDRFYRILSEVRGSELEAAEAPIAAGVHKWDELRHRLPILKMNPPEDFIEQMFVHFMDVIELEQLERELNEELEAVSENLDEDGWVRIQALTQSLSRRREECAREDQELAERAKRMRSAKPTYDQEGGAAAF
ncbi:DNA primase [Pseudovibrio exalbescens]|uniref:DNA primase n=1 Tax=Pseudovibrio exalbescens TaxID=197461 RepID=UPI0023665438|nr:DNA primase [Pseudovibrio exalbescens]MDD7910253.1 DNA primase [Pseudovibrio exalbescens]